MGADTTRRPTVVAVGGHSLLDPELAPTIENQTRAVARAMVPIAHLVLAGEPVVVTHGNGPQVGNLQLRSERAADIVPADPLDTLVADTQGSLGYAIERALRAELNRRGHDRQVVTLITEVEVDADDPAMTAPDKPIGPFYDAVTAERLGVERGWPMFADPLRGHRRVVPSPRPRRIVPLPTIATLVERDVVVVCCGGGGIPVTTDRAGTIVGVEAVIDKDRVSALLAVELGARRLVITTGVDAVYTGYYGARPRRLADVDVATLARLGAEGEFPSGSMGPKTEAIASFVEATGGEGLVCLPEELTEALAGRTGTRVRP